MIPNVFISKSDYDAVIFDLDGVEVYEPTIRLVHALRSGGLKTAVVSSSKPCREVLERAGVADLFDAKVDGQDLESLDLGGNPPPDIFLEAAKRLGVDPRRAVVVEDAISGVEAGRRGRFGLVIGVDRGGLEGELKAAGADVVVTALSSIGTAPPHALNSMEEIRSRTGDKTIAVFLDYDGTLTPIVSDPEKAILSEPMRQVLKTLSGRIPVSVISGRDLLDVQRMTSLRGIFYAGSHGFDIAGPQGVHMKHQKGVEFLPTLDQAEKELAEKLGSIKGARLERKKFAIAVHYRNVKENAIDSVKRAVESVASRHSDLRQSGEKNFRAATQYRLAQGEGPALAPGDDGSRQSRGAALLHRRRRHRRRCLQKSQRPWHWDRCYGKAPPDRGPLQPERPR